MADDDQSQADDEHDDAGDQQQQQQQQLTPEQMEAELREARQDAARYRRSLRVAEKERDDLKSATQTDSERMLAEARAETRAEVLAESNARLLKAEIRSAAAGKLEFPDDAVRFLDDTSEFIDDDGTIDAKAIERAVDDLVRKRPRLAPGPSENGSYDGGARSTKDKPADMNDLIRRGAGVG